MNDNLLLNFLTELGHGNWSHFRQGLEYLADEEDDLYRTVKARQLSMLGHVEFAFEGDLRWAVCEPTIAWLSREDRLVGVLCGSRSQRLLDTLTHWCKELGCELDQCSQTEGPDVIQVTVPSNDVGEQLAQQVGLKSQTDAVKRLIEILPTIQDYLGLCSYEPAPRGYKTERYDTQQLRWIGVDDSEQLGFYRYTHYRREYRLCIDDTVLKTPPYIGIFAWFQYEQRIVFEYDLETQIFTGPASAILPPLFARVATLCSGFLPKFEPKFRQHIYHDLPPGVAYHLLHKLHQEKN